MSHADLLKLLHALDHLLGPFASSVGVNVFVLKNEQIKRFAWTVLHEDIDLAFHLYGQVD